MIVSKTELAYAAGIVDGEGYVGLYRKVAPGPAQQYSFNIQVTNTRHELLGWLHERFGGSISPVRAAAGNKPALRWGVSGTVALAFAEAIRPYLLLKHEQADLGIEFQSLAAEYRNRGRRERPYSVSQKYERIYERLREINQRGARTYIPTAPLMDELPLPQEVAV